MDLLPSERLKFIVGDVPEASALSYADKEASNLVANAESFDSADRPADTETSTHAPNRDIDHLVAKGEETKSGEPSTTNSASDLVTKAKAKGFFRMAASYTQHVPIQPADLVEYEWPEKSGYFYFIQEQISELLDVKSFKRKYPDLARRTIESDERELLMNDPHVANVLAVHLLGHITALRSVEVMDLMSAEYPAIHTEYQKVMAERRNQALIEKQKELDLIKSDAKKLEELRKKAIKSASQFNQELQTTKKSERRFFLDTQTSVIQSAANRWLRLAASETRTSAYPVALIPGQFTSHYKKFDAEELYGMPLNTILDNDRLFPPKRERSPSPILVANGRGAKSDRKGEMIEVDVKAETDTVNTNVNETLVVEKPAPLRGRRPSTTSNGVPPAKRPRKSSTAANNNRVLFSEAIAASVTVKTEIMAAATGTGPAAINGGGDTPKLALFSEAVQSPPQSHSPIPEEEADEPKNGTAGPLGADEADGADEPYDDCCIVCNLHESEIPVHALSVDLGRTQTQTPFVRCADCGHQMHAGCIDMPPAMVDAVRTYAWRCAECKECTVCGKQDQEPSKSQNCVNMKSKKKWRMRKDKNVYEFRRRRPTIERKLQEAMMCCDLCDRGYHTFCTGVTVPPSSQFVCVQCRE